MGYGKASGEKEWGSSKLSVLDGKEDKKMWYIVYWNDCYSSMGLNRTATVS